MKSALTPEQTALYRQQGFIVIEDFLSPAELETWRQAVDEAVAQRGKLKLAGRQDWQSGDSFYDRVFTQRINLWMDHPVMRRLMLDPAIGKLAADLEGVDGIRIWHDQTLIKEAWANPTAWHLDNPYWSFFSPHSTSIWVALDDVTYENGCLYFIPGSHRESRFESCGIGENMGDLFKVYPQWAERRAVAGPMKAGSCSFHNGLTAHGAGPNMTPGRRRAMTCAYMPDGSTFNGQPNVLPADYLARLKQGDVLDWDEQNPLIYHRSKPYASA
ncbi:MAG: phytanoyl-CoA dioxygenase family protein [Candidatus Latescibacteria bacterium]|nr:phytanoyl-CoA dioxygenase family protein [Candidatus Latescibacterota bacterium]